MLAIDHTNKPDDRTDSQDENPLDSPLSTGAPGAKRQLQLNAQIVDVEQVTADLLILKVLPDSGVPPFHPGQYVSLGLFDSQSGGLIQRPYSIASSPNEGAYLEFCIAINPSGKLTSQLVGITAGERIYVGDKAKGSFHLEARGSYPAVDSDKELLLLATGTGIAPYMSLLRTASTLEPGRKLTLVHGVRLEEDLLYRTELEELSQQHPDFKYIPCVSREVPSTGVHHGRIGDVLASCTPDPHDGVVLLCGNPAMIDDVSSELEQQGFSQRTARNPDGNLIFERYW